MANPGENAFSIHNKLYRSQADRKLAGVCGGIGEYFRIDPNIVRVLWVIFTFSSAFFPGIIGYIAMAFIVPERQVIEGEQT